MRYRRIVGRGLAASGNDHQRPAEIWVATYNGTEPGLGEHPAERNGELANDVEPLARAAHAWCKPRAKARCTTAAAAPYWQRDVRTAEGQIPTTDRGPVARR